MQKKRRGRHTGRKKGGQKDAHQGKQTKTHEGVSDVNGRSLKKKGVGGEREEDKRGLAEYTPEKPKGCVKGRSKIIKGEIEERGKVQ